ncbi:hypothetical protein [Lederbergia citri]|uniref:Uncharacterized protein n=1 Tax=Lederbergia citri TaxID=2833580 RepID=A0A942TCE1_9BACI|nr:hypothetical protein [Lederbergia citri]MBS4193732.1 hypothetical protein [Lederbergia citri]
MKKLLAGLMLSALMLAFGGSAFAAESSGCKGFGQGTALLAQSAKEDGGNFGQNISSFTPGTIDDGVHFFHSFQCERPK